MKKILALVLVLSMVLGSFGFAFAATPAQTSAGEVLKELGVLQGDGTNLNLDQDLNRQDMVVLLSRLLGAEAEAKAFPVPTRFADVTDDFYKSYIGWAEVEGLTDGVSATEFGFGQALQVKQLVTFLLRALGYADAWNQAETLGVELGLVAAGTNFEATATRGVMAAATLGALNAPIADDAKVSLGDKLGFEGFELVPATTEIAEFKAVGAKKLSVVFNKEIDTTKATIEVKRGTVKPAVKAITFAADKMSAVVEFSTAMAAGDYTVTVTGVEETALTETVKVEAEKLTTIKFLSSVLVISVNNVTASLKAENQYGEDVSAKLATANVTYSKGTGASITNKGVLTVTGTAGMFNVDDKVVLTVVDSTTGVVANATLTVAKAAAVESITFGELTTDDEDLVGKEINVTAMTTNATKYYLPIEVVDQYGNVLKAADLVSGFDLITSNASIVQFASTEIQDMDDIGTVVKFQAAAPTATHGTAVITAVATSTGKSANTTIKVLENSKIDVVSLEAPATELKINKAVTLPIVITDTYGKEIALKDVTIGGAPGSSITLNTNTTLTVVNGSFSVSNDYVNKVTTIKLTPSAKNVVLTVTTATGKYQSLTLTANNQPVVSGIKGVKSTFATMLANDASLTTRLDDKIEFVDQYGDKITAPAFDATDGVAALDFTIAPKDATNAVTSYATGVITASTAPGTETYVITLKNAAGDVLDSLEVTVTVVDKDKITQFGIEDLNKFYTGAASSAHDQQVEIYGLVNGNKVVVDQDMIVNVSASNGLVIAPDGAYTAQSIPTTDDKDVTSTITVLVENAKDTFVVTKDVVYSSAARKAQSISIELDDKAVTGAVQITPVNTNNIVTTGTDGLRIFAEDQYGVELTSGYSFVITNNETGDATLAISSTGVITVGTPLSGKSFQIYTFIDGISANIKVVID